MKRFLSYLLVVVLGAAIGYGVLTTLVVRPKVAIINVSYVELDASTGAEIDKTLDYVRNDNSIKAVVIKLNSPGGTVSSSSDIFLNTVKVREKKPVVVLVGDMAASGGYMWLLGANYVYANPVSLVGNVGAILNLPGPNAPSEDVVATGPYKLIGASDRQFITWLETIKNVFIETAYSQRGDRLKLTRDELAQGRIYFGMEAVRLGIIDAIGTESDAINKAADLAGIRNYKLVDVDSELKKQGVSLSFAKYGAYSSNSLKAEFPYIYYMFWESK